MFSKITKQPGRLCVTDQCDRNILLFYGIYCLTIRLIKAGIPFHLKKYIHIQMSLRIFVFQNIMSFKQMSYFVIDRPVGRLFCNKQVNF